MPAALTLADAVTLALRESPRLRAFAAESRAFEAHETQAGRWANPELELEVENLAGSGGYRGVDAAETTLSVAQSFPVGGDLRRRRELAAARTRLAGWDYEAARLEVIVEVTGRFIDALAADRRLDLARRELTLARDTARVAAARIEAGDAPPIEAARTAVPVVAGEVAVQRAERLRDAAHRRLALTWGADHANFERLEGDLDAVQPPPDAALLVRLIHQNPAVARWTAEVGLRIAERRLAEAQAVPDLVGRVGARHHNDTGDASWVVGLSLPLPVFDRGEGDVLAARFAQTAADHRQREAERVVTDLLNTALAQLINAHAEAVALRDHALPAARHAHDATRRAFDEGQLAFLDVLDAQRTLIELERRYVEALGEYHTASAEIEALIGQRLADVSDSVPIQGESP